MKLNANQREFFYKLNEYDILVDSGTWRSGKSFELCLFAILRMKVYPGIREFVGRKELSALRETTFLKFQELLTDFFHLTQGRDYDVKISPRPEINFPNGSACVFGDLDITRVNKWLSAEYSDILIDEGQEISELAFEKIRSRQTQRIIEKLSNGTQKNKFLIAMNPPESADRHWTHRKFRDPQTKIPRSLMIYSSVEENRENIPSGYVEDMLSSVDKRTADIYLRGHWTPLTSRLVYPEYDFPEGPGGYTGGGNLRHLRFNPGLDSYLAMDFGWVHPMSIGCWQHDPATGTFYRLYEVVESYLRPEDYCKLLTGDEIVHNGKRYRLPFHLPQAVVITGAEALQRRQESSGQSNLSIMRQIIEPLGIKLRIHVVRGGIQEGILGVRNHVCNASGERRIIIDPRHCKRFIEDCRTYHYPTDSAGNITSELPEKDNISDHTQDEARYLINFVSPLRQNSRWRTS